MIKADSIIYGNIITLDSDLMLCKAMVVKDKKIVYIGSKEIANKMIGKKTKILDYKNCYIYPGFMDAHTHGPLAGESLVLQANMEDGKSMNEYVKIMAKYIKKHPDNEYYLGSGWDKYDEPTAEMLDKICNDKPVVLQSGDRHSLWLNTVALKKCKIDEAFIKKYGTDQVHVDKDGKASGLICEMPTAEVLKVFSPSIKDMKKALLAWQDFAFSQGITAVGEAFLDYRPEYKEAYKQLVNEGKWKLRTYAYSCEKDVSNKHPDKIGERLKELSNEYDSEYFKIAGLKIVEDGVVEAHTAALKEEYSDQPGYHGILNVKDQKVLNKLVLSANEAGFSVHSHTIGDLAANMILNAYEDSETKTCNFDARNIVCHLQVISKEDIKRCADYNVVAVVAPTWAPVIQPFFNQMIDYLGEERTWRTYPVKSFEDVGATICFHTDYPVNSKMDIPLSIYTAVKRAEPLKSKNGGPKSVMNPDEAISSYRALLALTTNIAYMFKQERNLGTLQIGKIANASVYTTDFVDYKNPEDIVKAELVATIVDGEEVYNSRHK